VGGGILVHGVQAVHEWITDAAVGAAAVPGVGVVLGALTPMLANAIAGVAAGGLAVLVVSLVQRSRPRKPANP
jgi:predicted DNA repair protein MutK